MTPEEFWANVFAERRNEHHSQNYNLRSSQLAQLIKAGTQLRDKQLADVLAECARSGEAMDPDFGHYVASRLAKPEGGGPLVDRRGRPSIHPMHDKIGAILFLSRVHSQTAEFCKKKRKPHDPWESEKLPRGALDYAFNALIGATSRPWETRKLETAKSVEQAYYAAKKTLQGTSYTGRAVPRET